MEKGLFYSESGLLNRVIFYSDYNDINIFVEDEKKEYIYENIFERMFNNTIKIEKILPMKGKPGVEKAFQEYGSSYNGKPAIYLVDGDFDLIMEKEMILNNNYIYLEKYNIESYYLDKKAVLMYMAGKLKKTKEEVSIIIKYSEWEKYIYDAMKELFINYMISQEVFPSEKNVGQSPYYYLNKDGTINANALNDYINGLKCRITDYDALYESYKRKFETTLSGDASRLICGKYLLASLSNYLRVTAGVSFKQDDFVYYLASSFEIKTLDYVKERILNVMHTKSEKRVY